MSLEAYEEARKNGKPDCIVCNGKGTYFHGRGNDKETPCPRCCPHDKGSWLLEKDYGRFNGMYCCLAGCGYKQSTKF